jgi:hypothetical protein
VAVGRKYDAVDQRFIHVLKRKKAEAFTLDHFRRLPAAVNAYFMTASSQRVSYGNLRIDMARQVPGGDEETRH